MTAARAVPQAEWDRANCMGKRHKAYNTTQAANLAYLLALSLGERTVAYRCACCGLFHVSVHRLYGDNAILCSWPSATAHVTLDLT